MTVNIDKMRQMYDRIQNKQNVGDIPFWKPKEGRNIIRILPPWSKTASFFKEGGYHYNVDGDSTLACPKGCASKPCPICEAVHQLYKTKSATDVEMAKQIKMKNRYFFNVIDLQDQDRQNYVQVFASGIKIFEQLLAYFAAPDWGDLTDEDNGFDVVIERFGSGIETDYKVMAARNPTPIKDKTVLNKLVDLDTLVNLLTYEELQAKLEGTTTPQTPTDTKKDTADTGPTPNKTTTKSTPKPVEKKPTGLPSYDETAESVDEAYTEPQEDTTEDTTDDESSITSEEVAAAIKILKEKKAKRNKK